MYEDDGVGRLPRAPFDKVVFMVVDALRRSEARCPLCATQKKTEASSDFVYSANSGFTFTQRYASGTLILQPIADHGL